MSLSLSEFNSVVEKFEEILGDEYVVIKRSAYTVEFNEGKVGSDPEYMTVQYMPGIDLFMVTDRHSDQPDTETKFDSKAEVYEYILEEFK